ncbi:hypothetical protein [Cellulomonas sp. URHD0024]|uniref:hypothetical protein n=1 Tax=Cellulomonas sp. URHD0024 TaxID=1302620 RepID=UPI0004134AFC|nr:hypothetical protein [Cellulomonas sp. URHD0024]
MSRFTYLPWIRTGLVATVTNPDPLSGPLPARAAFTATAVADGQEASVEVRVLGPGDVTALEAGLVARTQPAPGSVEVEPNYFCTAELRISDLPWMFTPAAPAQDRLRPWLVLVVVPTDTCPYDEGGEGRLPVLHVDDVSTQLPDLAQSHAWAHAQVDALPPADARRPPGLARLMCARLLRARTSYRAAIVPAFEPGRLGGLGLPVPETTTVAPAWDVATAGPRDLPVYYSWTFTTGADGDFEALVSRLQRVSLGDVTAAGRPASVHAQAGLPELPGWRFPGALGECPDPAPGAAFVAALEALVDGTASSADLAMPPPLYGGRPAAEGSIAASTRPWLRRLNLDPRYRAAAALGARLVQEHQEELMGAAWAQVGEVEAANALLRQAQLARSAGTALHGRLTGLDAAALVLLAGPLLNRVLDPVTGTTQAARVVGSRVPSEMVSAAFRRAVRPRGPLARRTGRTAADLLAAVDGGVPVVPERPRPDGMVSIDAQAPKDAPQWCRLTPERLLELAGAPPSRRSAQQWRATATALAEEHRVKPPCVAPPPRGGPLELERTRVAVLAAADPATTVPARIGGRVTGPPGWAPVDPLTPIMATPRLDAPLSRDLIALSPDLLLPGISALPAEAVGAVPANSRFVEALMVGANHEMLRELIWRGYPTDQRGTSLRRFWERSGSTAGATDDIPAVDDAWSGELGTHLLGSLEQVVLIVRGEVLRRYPGTLVYAARAQWVNGRRRPVAVPAGMPLTDPAHPERYPAFSGTIDPDVTFLGFDLPDDVLGDSDPAAGRPGWFFVFQQPRVQLRFGLDATRAETVPGQGPSDLSWPAVTVGPSGHVDLTGPLSDLVLPGWGPQATSADLAQWCEQRPFRVCIHASDLLQEPQA